jgi:hypothetical protein
MVAVLAIAFVSLFFAADSRPGADLPPWAWFGRRDG